MTVIYTALYRKWRPLSFDDVISQPHITTTLKNQIKNGRTAHAYLFTGSRGTGKTTCARIFAKAVNCPEQHDGNPCLQCSICKDADNAALSDIIEIDAASNNGVDDIRDLRDGAVYTPERCKYKVYIIDEVHMLTPNAFNALLKIMEEPPEYVKFILATTEVHKVPATITSRCQRFDFRRILTEDIKARLCYIAGKENISLDENAAGLIAGLSDGGMRDALSLLDQCAAYSDNITMDTVSAAAGIAGREPLFELIEAAADKQPGKALEIADKLYSMSKDMARLCSELTDQFRNLMLLKVCPEKSNLIICMPDELEKLKSLAKRLELSDILSKLEILQECSEKIGKSVNRRIELEMCLVKLCTGQNKQKTIDNNEIYDKIKQTDNFAPASGGAVYDSNAADNREPAKSAVNMSALKASDFKPLMEWSEILEEFTKVCPSVSGTLIGSRAFVYQDIMLIDTQNRFFLKLFKVRENLAVLRSTIQKVMGKSYTIKARCSAAAETEQKAEKLVEKAMNSGIETAVE
ncbi:DNA polymerase III subunit gamma/tau [Porcipelethomonas sp.]|uniref:DNA polymerase III subunit gamma/tau n=1 Tax=Porcipelethomonas sp. TaxID=2981675 RepID=UPI003EF8E7C9